MLERTHLRMILEVERQGSLTAAADVLCLTQSALSHAIKKLEQYLGTPIWQRDGRRLRLTQAGHHLLGVARRILPQLEEAERRMRQYAQGERGTLRIGMECHPCYEWLLQVVSPYLAEWRDVDVDVKQKFQFGGIGALFDHEIDLLVTPDPLYKPGLRFVPVFDYEMVLTMSRQHRLATRSWITPEHLSGEVLITYPVENDRLDIFRQFLTPAGISPKRHKRIETTDILLQMVASGRGVAALPRWLVETHAARLELLTAHLGRDGLFKQIFLGTREADTGTAYLDAFIELARRTGVAHR